MSSHSILIYCDGACSGNPGPGGWGSIIITEQQVKELGQGAASTTNNRMEMTAVLSALQHCLARSLKSEKIEIYTDSVYVIRGMTQWMFGWKRRGWKTAENEDVSNRDLWEELDQVYQSVRKQLTPTINWHFVKGHAGVPGNERCDEIAVAFSKMQYISLYAGSPEAYIFDVRVLPEERPLPEMRGSKTSADNKKSWYLSYVNGVLSRHESWAECEAVVKGRPAKFKKVSSESEEKEIKKSWGVN